MTQPHQRLGRLRSGWQSGLAALAGGAALLLCQTALAQPTVELLVPGNCPSRTALEMAVRARGLGIGHGSFLLEVRSEPGAAILVLKDTASKVLVERTLRSEDCTALAAAAAVIVEGYFVEIGSLPGQRALPRDTPEGPENALPNAPVAPFAAPRPNAAAPAPAPLPPTGASSSPTASPDVSQTPRSASAGPSPAAVEPGSPAAVAPGSLAPVASPTPSVAAPGSPVSVAPGSPVSVAPGSPVSVAPTTPESSKRARARLGGHVLAGAGIEMSPELGHASALLRLGAGLDGFQSPITLRLDLATTTPSEQTIPDRVSRWASRAALRVGMPLRKPLPPLEPWVGMGVSYARIRAPDLPNAATSARWSAVFEIGVGWQQAISRTVGVRADVGCYVLGNQELYQIEPDGEVGRGPRFGCNLAPALLWDWSPAPPSAARASTQLGHFATEH